MGALWTHADAAAATGGTASAPFAVTGLSIDTRSLQEGDLFIALKAARDGHDFVAQAFANGAAAALVDHIPEGVTGPCLVVPDVLKALEALGAAGRARARAKVVAVTGSVGKTSTKEMLREMLAEFGTVHAAEASFNNHWGVPITLARLPQSADFAVVEIGMNHPGEIAPLAALTRPDVALITTVAAAHLEAFADVAAIAREKAAIFGALTPQGTAIYNADLDTTPILREAAGAQGTGFGENGDLQLASVRHARGALVVEAKIKGESYWIRLTDSGAHFGMNALGCMAVAEALGLDLALAAQALGRWQPPAGRGKREILILDPVQDASFTLIDDAFNANPASLAAALDVLANTTPGAGGRRIAILGDMLELGPQEQALHLAVASHPAMATIDRVHCVGPRMQTLYTALPEPQRGHYVPQAEDLGAKAHRLVHPGDVVLVKGSKGSYVSRVVDALRNLGHAQPDDPNGE
ncbi:UDP-N-acetylmuramoyl-tripeptide--D-alanyl-D-alanine ligase [Pararhodobacter oceanensis]|uniref:UDP-N-acetylmuramoyl-tripeptide--D-alanyl-D- alanine ligase n=1 Tax=Pararhodobacter oceanensis TaxID=2172121 RepID=UPI003A932308